MQVTPVPFSQICWARCLVMARSIIVAAGRGRRRRTRPLSPSPSPQGAAARQDHGHSELAESTSEGSKFLVEGSGRRLTSNKGSSAGLYHGVLFRSSPVSRRWRSSDSVREGSLDCVLPYETSFPETDGLGRLTSSEFVCTCHDVLLGHQRYVT